MTDRSYCMARSSSGYYCILDAGHAEEDHLSIDNQQLWKGTPGAPIWWKSSRASHAERQTTGEVPLEALDPTLTQGEAGLVASAPRTTETSASHQPSASRRVVAPRDASPSQPPPVSSLSAMSLASTRLPGFTGELCSQCGSPNTVRRGSCLQCHNPACGFNGECG